MAIGSTLQTTFLAISATTMGGYTGSPSKKDPGHPDYVVAEFRKKVGKSPPADGPAGGGFGHFFFSDFGDRVGWVPRIFLKNWSKQGVPPANTSHTFIEATLRIRAYTSFLFFFDK